MTIKKIYEDNYNFPKKDSHGRRVVPYWIAKSLYDELKALKKDKEGK